MSKIISYASNFEDVLLNRAFAGQATGFYIDVGAYEPVEHSVTKLFYDRGWRGINVEPNPTPFEMFQAERVRDVNLNIGLSNREGMLTFYSAPRACWSADPNFLADWFGADRNELVERSVPVVTLASLCKTHVPDGQTIDFLKIDVENHEGEVIQGGDWQRWRPRVVLVEANVPEAWESVLLEANYLFAFFDGVNRYFVREEDRQLLPALSVPVSVADNFWVHGYLRRIWELEGQVRELQRQLDERPMLGPITLDLALRLHQTSLKYPRIAAAIKPLIQRSAG